MSAPTANNQQSPQVEVNFNPFDEFGLLLGTERLPGESNLHFRNRLLDVGKHIPGASLETLLNAISRDLSLKPDYDAINFAAGTEGSVLGAEFIDDNPFLEIAQTGIFYDSDNLKTEESLTVDAVNLSLSLSEYPRYEEDVKLSTSAGEISKSEYTVDRYKKKVQFNNDTYTGQTLTVEYHYRKYFPFCSSWPEGWATVHAMQQYINEFTNASGTPYINMTVDSSGSALSCRMLRVPRFAMDREGLDIHVYQVSIWELFDPYFLDLLENTYGHHYDTDLEGWAHAIASKASISWGNCVLDSDSWALTSMRNVGVLKHIFDNLAIRVYENKSNVYSIGLRNYSPEIFFTLGGYSLSLQKLRRNGMRNLDYKSGIGNGDDIKMVDIVKES